MHGSLNIKFDLVVKKSYCTENQAISFWVFVKSHQQRIVTEIKILFVIFLRPMLAPSKLIFTGSLEFIVKSISLHKEVINNSSDKFAKMFYTRHMWSTLRFIPPPSPVVPGAVGLSYSPLLSCSFIFPLI
jgi:hypothetical protein